MTRMKDSAPGNIDPSKLLPSQSIDCVIFGYADGELKILLLKWKYFDHWTLPGGHVHLDEDLDAAAVRILQERTGIVLPFLRQFHTFGSVDRYSPALIEKSAQKADFLPKDMIEWLKQRFVSTGYVSLIDHSKSEPTPDLLSSRCEWKSINALPELILDHGEIISRALEYLRIQINYLPFGINLLPEKFTMKEFQQLYESILERKLDRANFQKKMLKLGFLIRQEKLRSGGAHKAPYLYSFDPERYNQLLDQGIGFI
jgi:ADP-ribose pyrophosphatase YjhB (NUDIX family)